ncbi:MAG: GGDEF domain-containing protein [Gammaproteobacteria bacterium]|nr:GGDEF domain-containing protein [Gammaproteobacteria bacterium]
MEYKESLHKASEITRQVIQVLSKLNLPMNPVYYAIWYEYFLGRSPALTRELDKVRGGEIPLNDDFADILFIRYVASADIERLSAIERDIQRLLGNIMQLVKDAGGNVERYVSVLKNSSCCLTDAHDVREIQTIVSGLLKETETVLYSQQNYHGRLDSTAMEIHNLRSELSRVREEASQDTLTGLANRKMFNEAINKAVERNKSEQEDVCLLMIDIDHFKNINDTHGHIIGDQVLKFVASLLKQSVKGRDLVARYGGEEFSIILWQTPLIGAVSLAENIRNNIEQSAFKRKESGQTLGKITISIGVEIARPGDNAESLIERADKALYYSKRNGRNKVTTAEESAMKALNSNVKKEVG